MVVDDDVKLRSTISDYLLEFGFDVLSASDGAEAINVFEAEKDKIDLVLLDIMMPKIDGYDVLKIIRKTSDVPVIMLSAREHEKDQLKGYELGVDNYITKPFLLSVLKENIKACIQRASKTQKKLIERGALSVDKSRRCAYLDNRLLELTPKEFDVLLYLIENEHRVLERESILDAVWGIDYYGDFRTVDTIIKQLRKKLGENHNYIRSVYGVGYFFDIKEE
ncbi:MAG: response regulator transcription factor [Acutalibacteraceae bacterium]|nr:response regulator transcription factor [Acutalibacteraceae bacterium]